MSLGKPNPLDVLFLLDEAFGTGARLRERMADKAKKAQAAPPVEKPKTLTYEQRVAQVLSGKSDWRPVARVAHIVIQHCRCCDSSVEYLGALHIRHEAKRATPLSTSWDCEVPPSPHYSLLPQLFIEHRMEVSDCPACLRVESSMCTFPADRVHQAQLFN